MRRAFLFCIICTAYTLSLCDFSPSARNIAAVDYKTTGHSRLNKRAGTKMVHAFGRICESGSFYPLTQINKEWELICTKIIKSKTSSESSSPRASPFRAAPKSPDYGDKKLPQYKGKMKPLADQSQLYEHRIGPKGILGKLRFKGSDLIVVKYIEGGNCETVGIIHRRFDWVETKCKSGRKWVSEKFAPVNPLKPEE